MIAMSDYYLLIHTSEIGPEVQKLIDVHRQCGCVETVELLNMYKIHNASEQDQKAWFAAFERAMDKDFPPPCEECGLDHEDCCCEPETDSDAEIDVEVTKETP